MRYVLLGYIGLFGLSYLLMAVSEFFLTPAKERDPLRETLVDFGCGAILLAGMLFLATGVSDLLLRQIWLIAAPLAVLLQLALSWRARRREAQSSAQGDTPPSFLLPDLGTLLLSLPALGFNLQFALAGWTR
ncbi:hypothetical protein OJ996_23460 [Luteolibacter sp. GHJ8]|uniref:Uncharacterized protein n=1 Tax=Luteolibacter rhizosphaerae TaxID=2989719 RepID=A0ABT3GBE6_9BACT|nr:hypothetical protein [Luteolibacter rhizosphaerae]MCW1916565.1 hypothetical protein [Luteolibacter rhizosphaerae]